MHVFKLRSRSMNRVRQDFIFKLLILQVVLRRLSLTTKSQISSKRPMYAIRCPRVVLSSKTKAMINFKMVQEHRTLVKLDNTNVEMEENVFRNQKHRQLWCRMEINHHLLPPTYMIANVHPSLKENFVTKDVRYHYFIDLIPTFLRNK